MFQAWLTLPAQSPSPVPVGMEPPPQGDKECQAALKQHPQPTEPWQGLKLGDGEMSERAGRKAEERGSPPCELQMLWRPRAHSELSLVCRDLEGMTAPRVLSNSEGLVSQSQEPEWFRMWEKGEDRPDATSQHPADTASVLVSDF